MAPCPATIGRHESLDDWLVIVVRYALMKQEQEQAILERGSPYGGAGRGGRGNGGERKRGGKEGRCCRKRRGVAFFRPDEIVV
jgi:hypothetical protein